MSTQKKIDGLLIEKLLPVLRELSDLDEGRDAVMIPVTVPIDVFDRLLLVVQGISGSKPGEVVSALLTLYARSSALRPSEIPTRCKTCDGLD